MAEVRPFSAGMPSFRSASRKVPGFIARLAAQHEEIVRLREAAAGAGRVSRLPAPGTTVIGTCG
ncbi:hypothetical protein FEF34_34730 [Streptomyces marianii]|uniref:Uncharacterized protein n=1 Tax=Streptomyces marianii TaxID=1817406 RepID=A0A5R9EBS9_9ACTN|nr:hypothetical protein FEF34_34730 [Streptomyces marianii]